MSCFLMQYFANACIAAILKNQKSRQVKTTLECHAHAIHFQYFITNFILAHQVQNCCYHHFKIRNKTGDVLPKTILIVANIKHLFKICYTLGNFISINTIS
jgi:hypothetical protein